MQSAYMAQVIATDIGVLLVGFALHALPNVVGYRFCSKTLVDTAVGFYSLSTYDFTGLPLG